MRSNVFFFAGPISAIVLSCLLYASHASPIQSPKGTAESKIDVCNISYLWPVPATLDDVKALIGADHEDPLSKQSIWPESAFKRMLEIAESDAAAIKHPTGATRKIRLNPEFRRRENWKVAGIRIDGGAPGSHSAIVAKFGPAPQLRIVLQPVTATNGKVQVHDVAAHLVFNFVKSPKDAEKGFLPINVPDKEAFAPVIADVLELKTFLKTQGIDTAGVKLGVHPGLQPHGKLAEFRDKVSKFLKSHLNDKRLTAMAFMGLAPAPEPWIFVAAVRDREGVFGPASVPAIGFASSQMLTARDGAPEVFPAATATNRNAISNFLGIRPEDRRGVSTAPLFDANTKLDVPAILGRKADGSEVADEAKESPVLNRDIPDFIANPGLAHFFNTDCVSCHTESTRRKERKIEASPHRFKLPAGISPIDEALLPKEPWNVRNFGWFPSFF